MLHIVYLVVAADPSSSSSNFVTIAQLHVFQMVNVYFSTHDSGLTLIYFKSC